MGSEGIPVRDLNIRGNECVICCEPFKDPYLLPLCGHSFDKICLEKLLKRECPVCRNPFDINQICNNISLRHAVEDNVMVKDVYELICIDNSTSMRYSDGWLPFVGKSRFEIGQMFCEKLIEMRKKASNHFVGIARFNIDFEFIQPFSKVSNPLSFKSKLYELKAIGKHTAIFDAVECCYRELKEHNRNAECRLVLVTDGGNNYSSPKNTETCNRFKQLLSIKKELQIVTEVFHVGPDPRECKTVADGLEAPFHALNEGNILNAVGEYKRKYPCRKDQWMNLLISINTPYDEPAASIQRSANAQDEPNSMNIQNEAP